MSDMKQVSLAVYSCSNSKFSLAMKKSFENTELSGAIAEALKHYAENILMEMQIGYFAYISRKNDDGSKEIIICEKPYGQLSFQNKIK
ncbi:MAG: hypothetical protein LBV76_01635 [Deltaproteobacteria bacterium]|jgi:hypothetical protein|nr:hypothetical protein [Deltaproteobacteria bacterium]